MGQDILKVMSSKCPRAFLDCLKLQAATQVRRNFELRMKRSVVQEYSWLMVQMSKSIFAFLSITNKGVTNKFQAVDKKQVGYPRAFVGDIVVVQDHS